MATLMRSNLRALRQRCGVRQHTLAAQAGVSRQTLSTIEAGTTVPSTQIALCLARVLKCRVEDIFSLEERAPALVATLAGDDNAGAPPSGPQVRVAMGQIGRNWVARALDREPGCAPGTPADGIASVPARRRGAVRVSPLRKLEDLQRNLFVAGCDPALGLLGRHLEERLGGPRLHWLDLASRPALDELASGRVHVAGLHLDDVSSGNLNAATVQSRLGRTPTLLVTLATWELGIAYRARPGQALKGVADLTRKGLRFVAREPGSGAEQLLQSALAQAGISLADLNLAARVRGHSAVARAVASNLGDAGITTRAAATACQLSFTALAEARFDLALLAASAADERVQTMLDALTSARFRADLGAIAGYRAERTGTTVAGADA
jgi:molybdate-binding protein/DNA-binding XRE family transcriptional regulator